MKTLYLIDGHAQFFRAYHAIRTRMTSPVTKEPTNATFGFRRFGHAEERVSSRCAAILLLLLLSIGLFWVICSPMTSNDDVKCL